MRYIIEDPGLRYNY